MAKLTKHFDDSKLVATASHLDKMIERMKVINLPAWPDQFGEAIQQMTAIKAQYHIESIVLNHEDGMIDVDYCMLWDFEDFQAGRQPVDEVVWFEERISCAKLQAFVLEEKMNHFCRDWADHNGQHCQETGVIPIEDLMEEYDFLQSAVKAYLEAGKETE